MVMGSKTLTYEIYSIYNKNFSNNFQTANGFCLYELEDYKSYIIQQGYEKSINVEIDNSLTITEKFLNKCSGRVTGISTQDLSSDEFKILYVPGNSSKIFSNLPIFTIFFLFFNFIIFQIFKKIKLNYDKKYLIYLLFCIFASFYILRLINFDEIIISTGVVPRKIDIEGQDKVNFVYDYQEVFNDRVKLGNRIAIIGAGGIGFDVAEYISSSGISPTLDINKWMEKWGVTDPAIERGGVLQKNEIRSEDSSKEIFLLQRKNEKVGKRLGKTTGWIHRKSLEKKKVKMLAGVNYEKITPEGLLISFGEEKRDIQKESRQIF